jgi:hypothetical protein
MGSFLVKLLTNPEDFQFYAGNSQGQVGSVSTVGSFGQKSIPFGNDRPGGGSSKQPYIKSSIKEDFKNPAFYSDFVLRGGILAPLAAAEDTARLTKYFTDIDNPSGILFAAKQNILSRTGVKTEATQPTPAYLGGALNEGVYLPTSTLAQTLVGFAGTTLNKQGIDPTGFIPGLAIRNYQKAVYRRNQDQTVQNTTPKSVQRKTDKVNQNIIKNSENLSQTQQDLKKQTAYNPVAPSPLNFEGLGNERVNQINNRFNKQEQKQFESDVKWDQIKESRLKKRINNLEEESENLQEDLSSIIGGNFSNRLLKLWNKFGLNPNNEKANNSSTLLSYGGGPGSILGFSRTKIKFATSNDGETPLRTGYVMVDPYEGIGYLNHSPSNPLKYGLDPIFDGKQLYSSVFRQYQKLYPSITEEQYFGVPTYFNNTLAGGYDGSTNIQPWTVQSPIESPFLTLSAEQLFAQPKNPNAVIQEDFRASLDPQADTNYTFLSLSPSYKTKAMESDAETLSPYGTTAGRVGLRSPGRKGNISNYALGKRDNQGNPLGPVDVINALPIYRSTAVTDAWGVKNDLVKFRIDILDPDDLTNKNKFFMHFRAFINSFNDSYNAEWSALNYMGRGEKFWRYGGFDRKINMTFSVAALSKEELIPMYRKLNFLASSLAPSYTSNGYMGGNFAQITVGGYIYEQPGIITSLEYTIPEDSPWEIGIPLNTVNGDKFEDKNVKEMPHRIDVSLSFTPIHQFRPQLMDISTPNSNKWDNYQNGNLPDKNTYGKQRFIALADATLPAIGKNNYENPIPSSPGNTPPQNSAQNIPVQSNEQTNLLVSPNAPANSDITLGNQGVEVTGLPQNNVLI